MCCNTLRKIYSSVKAYKTLHLNDERKLYNEKLIAVLLVVVIAATALSITTFARSEYDEGHFQGYQWILRLNSTTGKATGTFTWQGRQDKCCYLYVLLVKGGEVVTNRGMHNYTNRPSELLADKDNSISYAECRGYVGSNCICSTSVRP